MTQQEGLTQALAETRRALEAVRAGFQETADCDLLTYYLYQAHALEARYAYLLRRMREEPRG